MAVTVKMSEIAVSRKYLHAFQPSRLLSNPVRESQVSLIDRYRIVHSFQIRLYATKLFFYFLLCSTLLSIPLLLTLRVR